MIRRSMLPLALAATAVLSGCGTSDTDVIASVGDVELRQDEFKELVAEELEARQIDSSPDDPVSSELTRNIATRFVVTELLRAEHEALGIPVPDYDGSEVSKRAASEAEAQLLVQSWRSLPTEILLDDQIRNLYERGHEASGIICAAHILVATEAEADEVLAELEAGADFAAVAAARSTDPGSAQNGGSLGCTAAEQFAVAFVPAFAEAGLAAEIGVPTDPVETQFGFHVIRLAPTDELGPDAIVPLRVRTLADRYEVSVASRIGRWDPSGAVVPIDQR